MNAWLHAGLVELEALPALARAAEAAGFHGLALSDHVAYPREITSRYPYGVLPSPEAPFPDAWVTVAALAATTTRLQFMTKVYLAAARPPLLVARAVATAAILSGYRVSLGVGAGWMREDFELMGESFELRGARLDEHLEVLRKLWGEGWVEHHGRHYDFAALRLSPRPQRPIAVYCGGESESALRRAARLDGWLGAAYEFDRLADLLQRLSVVRAGVTRGAAGEASCEYQIIAGLPRVPSLEDCHRMEDLGLTGFSVAPWADDRLEAGPGRCARMVAAVERFGDAVVRRL